VENFYRLNWIIFLLLLSVEFLRRKFPLAKYMRKSTSQINTITLSNIVRIFFTVILNAMILPIFYMHTFYFTDSPLGKFVR